MLFNSIDFAVFLPIVFILYWFIFSKKLIAQNLLMVIASYCFYGWWDWRFLSLIFFSTTVDYSIGLALYKTQNQLKRKQLLWISIAINLGLLGVFKYYNFFLDNLVGAFSLFGTDLRYNSLNIILPVGISFYTFQTLSYTIDIYKKELAPTKSFISFVAFVSFFPQLVAGPIERAKKLLPQFENKRIFDLNKAKDGLKQILWGLFKKVVIADNCAIFVDEFFGNHEAYSGSTLLIGAFFFTIQIYCDFSGYSDIAIGVSRLFGFNLSKNFSFPYFSRNIGEFWRRWHISLTTWFRDYVYIPLGGSRSGLWLTIRNVFIVFILSGFWHGANWTFIIWGILHALCFIPSLVLKTNRKYVGAYAQNKIIPTFKEAVLICSTFGFLVFTWVIFRANNLHTAVSYFSKIASVSLFSIPEFPNRTGAILIFIFILFFLFIEWSGQTNEYAIGKLGFRWKRQYRWGFYYILVFCIFYFYAKPQQFIYFQF